MKMPFYLVLAVILHSEQQGSCLLFFHVFCKRGAFAVAVLYVDFIFVRLSVL